MDADFDRHTAHVEGEHNLFVGEITPGCVQMVNVVWLNEPFVADVRTVRLIQFLIVQSDVFSSGHLRRVPVLKSGGIFDK